MIQARGVAEGEALEARAKGLASESDAVIAQQIADRLPEIVAAAAGAFDNIDTMTVLNGADGITEALTSIIGVGRSVLDTVQQRPQNGNGRTPIADRPQA